jgi:uncharacterized protein YjiS (DUF1127 family)
MSVDKNSCELAQSKSSQGPLEPIVTRLVKRALRRWRRSRAINELRQLDNRMLEDIGISYNDIPLVVDRLFDQEEVNKNSDRDELSAIIGSSVALASCQKAA